VFSRLRPVRFGFSPGGTIIHLRYDGVCVRERLRGHRVHDKSIRTKKTYDGTLDVIIRAYRPCASSATDDAPGEGPQSVVFCGSKRARFTKNEKSQAKNVSAFRSYRAGKVVIVSRDEPNGVQHVQLLPWFGGNGLVSRPAARVCRFSLFAKFPKTAHRLSTSTDDIGVPVASPGQPARPYGYLMVRIACATCFHSRRPTT